MALYSLVQGGLVNALDSQQIINLLTGVMTDQQVTVANRIRASLTGSANASGYVGGTVSGAPGSGAHLVGDFSIDQSGTIWICTVAGTPGTFVHLAQVEGGTGEIIAPDFKATGAASLGNPRSGRFIGNWTTAGAPTGLTSQVGDHGIDGNGAMWVATVAGTPGTWTPTQRFYDNNSTASVSAAFAADTYLAGSAVTIPVAGAWKVGTLYRCAFDMVKTAAGVAGFVITVRMGTLGTTGDASVYTFTFGAGTAVADTGTFVVEILFRSVGSGTSAVVAGYAMVNHHLAATGLTATGASGTGIILPGASAGFNSTTQTIIGISINGGASFSGTNTFVVAKADNV